MKYKKSNNMKKIIFCIILCSISTVSFGTETNESSTFVNTVSTLYGDGKAVVDTLYQDSKSVVSTVYDDIKDGVKSVYPDVKAAVVEIAKALGVGAEYVFKVLVLKFVVDGAKELLFFIFALIILIIGFKGLKPYFKTTNSITITYKIIPFIVITVIGIIMFFFVDFNQMLMGLINPGYGAINYILDFTKSMI